MSAGDSDIAAIRAAFEVIGRRLETLCAIGQLADVRLRRQARPPPRPPTIGRHAPASKLLTEEQVAGIRAGVRVGMPGPMMLRWIEQLLADRDERIRLERERKRRAY